MTELRDYFHAYPQELKVGTLRSNQRCVRDKLYVAVRGLLEKKISLLVEWESPGDQVTVFRGDPHLLERCLEPSRLSPVYRLPPSGPALIPTGLVFARFEEGTAVEDRRQEIAEAGYEIESIPVYAAHSAWLKAIDGQVSSALVGIAALEALPNIVNVEPQLLAPRVQR